MSYLQAAMGAYQLIKSGNESLNAKAKAKELEASRPKIGRDVNADLNLSLAKSDLANGMSAKTEQAYNNLVDRQFSSSLSSILKGGGDVNSIGEMYGNTEDGRQKLAMFRESMRMNQIKNLVDASDTVYERNVVTPFQVNEYAPWADAAQANAMAKQQAAKGENDGMNTMVSGIMNAVGGGMGGDEERENKQLFKDEYGTSWRKNYNWSKKTGNKTLSDYNNFQNTLRTVGAAIR